MCEDNPAHTLVVVSYYDRRPVQELNRLLESMTAIAAGDRFDVCVVVNSTRAEKLVPSQIAIPVDIVSRQNVGMNIGAWDYGWRNHRGYESYLFLQDECYIVREGWLSAFRQRGTETTLGMVGESLNQSWDLSWNELRVREQRVVLPDHITEGQPVNRVDYYLKVLDSMGIESGVTGRHLRSLVWFFRGDVLSRIDGFPLGRNYAECIAAEIGVSKRVEGLGLRVEQLDKEPFRYIRHREWNQDRAGDPFTHSSTIERRIAQLESPSWRMLGQMFARKLSRSLCRKGPP